MQLAKLTTGHFFPALPLLSASVCTLYKVFFTMLTSVLSVSIICHSLCWNLAYSIKLLLCISSVGRKKKPRGYYPLEPWLMSIFMIFNTLPEKPQIELKFDWGRSCSRVQSCPHSCVLRLVPEIWHLTCTVSTVTTWTIRIDCAPVLH